MRNTRSTPRAYTKRWRHDVSTQWGFRLFFRAKSTKKMAFHQDWRFLSAQFHFQRWKAKMQQDKGKCVLHIALTFGNVHRHETNASCSVSVKCWHGDTYVNFCCNKRVIKTRATRFQQRVNACGHNTDVIYHNRELFGHSTSRWVSWCDAQNKMMPGCWGWGGGCLSGTPHEAKQSSFQN